MVIPTDHVRSTWRTSLPGPSQVLIVLVVGTAIRLFALLLFRGQPLTSDPRSYFDQAIQLSQGGVSKPYYWPVGTSAAFTPWITLFGASHFVARVAASFYSLMLVPAVMLLTSVTMNRARVTLISGWILALYPPAVLMGVDPQSHIVAAIPFCIAVTSLIRASETRRYRWWIIAGASLGCLAVTRPACLLLVPILPILGLWLSSRSARTADVAIGRRSMLVGLGLLVTGFTVVVWPVASHNFHRGAGLTLATNDSVNLFLGNNRFTPLYWTSSLASGSRGADFESYYERLKATGNRNTALRSEAVKYSTSHPSQFAIRTLNRTRAYWGFDYYRTAELRSNGWHPAPLGLVLLLEAGGFLVAGLLAIAGLIGPLATRRTWQRDLLLSSVVLLAAPYSLTFSVGIYHFLAMVALMPIIAASASTMLATGAIKSARQLTRSWPFMACLALVAIIQIEYAYWLTKYA